MRKLEADITKALKAIGKEDPSSKQTRRIAEVRRIWAAVVEEEFLKHTNSVSIVVEQGMKKLVVYVDESIYAAELNARRELIKLKIRQKFGEDIEVFDIKISYGAHKKNYPYRTADAPPREETAPSVPLDPQEYRMVEDTVASVANERLRETLKKAMVADLEWKKGVNEKKHQKE